MSSSEVADFFQHPIFLTLISAVVAVLIVLLIYKFAMSSLMRALGAHPYAQIFLKNSIAPVRLLLVSLTLQMVFAAAPSTFPHLYIWTHAALLLLIAAFTWLIINALNSLNQVLVWRHQNSVEDDLSARRLRTKMTVLVRLFSGAFIFVGVCVALITFPTVRQVGSSLLASAGLAGLVLGFAAKSVLGNLVAGLQIGLAQPFRIDDVVVVQGEWGRIEEIQGAYIVVKIWDERRLIVPLQWFIENPFQNWTRTSANITGAVFLWVDYSVPLEPLRQEFHRICQAAPDWDQRISTLQVTDASDRAMQIRALVSSENAGKNWELRCRVREGLIVFLRREYPQALPHLRTAISEAVPTGIPTAKGFATAVVQS